MTTTIQVSDETKQMLNSLQKKEKKSYDNLLKEILLPYTKAPSSLFGSYKDLRWSKKDRVTFKNE